MNRRDFLKASGTLAGLVALEGCSPYLGNFYEKNQKYNLEKGLRKTDLAFNSSNNLRRYKSKHGDPITRESELVNLARTEIAEESFCYTTPDKVWYETGILENDRKVTPIASILIQNSGRGNLPKFNSINLYHYHPTGLVANLIFDYAKNSNPPVSQDIAIKTAYKTGLRYRPPSVQDFLTGVDLDALARKKGIKLTQRVADVHGIWEYKFGEELLKPYFANGSGKDKSKKVAKLIKSERIEEFPESFKGSPKGYITRLSKALKANGLTGNKVELSYRPISLFKPSEQEFLNMLKKWKLVI